MLPRGETRLRPLSAGWRMHFNPKKIAKGFYGNLLTLRRETGIM